MGRLVTKSTLARARGCTPAAITNALKGPLGAALVNGRIDIEHPAAVAYLSSPRQGGRPPSSPRPAAAELSPAEQRAQEVARARAAGPLPGPPPSSPEPASAPVARVRRGRRGRGGGELMAPVVAADGVPTEELMQLTVAEVFARFGDQVAFREYTDAVYKIQQAIGQEQKNLRESGAVISRELVRKTLLGFLDSFTRRLLSDVPKTLAIRIRQTSDDSEAEREAYATLQALTKASVTALVAGLRRVTGEEPVDAA